jgi:uncharacterized membrane protein YjjB (DUF3815 family)
LQATTTTFAEIATICFYIIAVPKKQLPAGIFESMSSS